MTPICQYVPSSPSKAFRLPDGLTLDEVEVRVDGRTVPATTTSGGMLVLPSEVPARSVVELFPAVPGTLRPPSVSSVLKGAMAGGAFLLPIVSGGQSNDDGRGGGLSGAAHPGVLLLTKGNRVEVLREPSGKYDEGWVDNSVAVPSSLLSPGNSYRLRCGKELAKMGVTPLFAPSSIGSHAIAHFYPGATEDDLRTPFGALTSRARSVTVDGGIPPTFLWVGHEANAGQASANLSTGALSGAYGEQWATLMQEIRMRFPSSKLIFGQLCTNHPTQATAVSHGAVGEFQRRSEAAFGDFTAIPGKFGLKSYPYTGLLRAVQALSSGGTVSEIPGGFRLSTPSALVEAIPFNVTPGTPARIRFRISGSGAVKVFVGSNQVGGAFSPSASEHVLEFTSSGSGDVRFMRNAGATDVSVTGLVLDHALTASCLNTHMVPMWDLPVNINDWLHLSTAAQDELGRRFALAIAEHVLEMPDVDGTGPRLVSVSRLSAGSISVQFDREILPPVSGYSDGGCHLQVYVGGAEVPATAERGADGKSVLLTLPTAPAGQAVVTHGWRVPVDASRFRTDVITGAASAIPAPTFGPVVAS